MKYHLFGHMDKNLVKLGDKVEQYKTPIGTIGKGNGNNFYAHLHFSISEGLTTDELYRYVIGWGKEKTAKYYIDPSYIDFDKMFGRKMDVGNRGYGYLQPIDKKNSFHPGVDVNGLGGGDTDFGYEFTSSCNGKVIYEVRTDGLNGGWGNLIIVAEDDTVTEDVKECECEKCKDYTKLMEDYKILDNKLNTIKQIINE